MRKNENSGFYLINYAKIGVKEKKLLLPAFAQEY